MKLFVTIDTEEDNWSHYSANNNPVENIQEITSLQTLFDRYGVKPTYLITYPVATNPKSVRILKGILDDGRCEIGMHCHPWNTPPFEPEKPIIDRDTMLCNLEPELQNAKLDALHEVIQDRFDIVPQSFRAGRYGFGNSVASALERLGYRVDTSVTPYVNWHAYHGPDFTDFDVHPFRFDGNGLDSVRSDGSILEIPVTIGFLQPQVLNFRRLMQALNQPLARKLHVAGILERARLVNKVWLSPELSSGRDMILLAKRMRKNGLPFLNLTFHSTSLLRGFSPFVRSLKDSTAFIKKIEMFLKFANSAGFECSALSEIEQLDPNLH